MTGHIVVCGLGHVGYRIADLLLRLGEKVAVIASDAREDWLELLASRGVLIVRGCAAKAANLHEAGIETAKAVIAATDDDQANVSIALDAKRLNTRATVVVRLFDQQLAHRVESVFGIRRALGTSAIAAPTFAAAALGEKALGFFTVDGAGFIVQAKDELIVPCSSFRWARDPSRSGAVFTRFSPATWPQLALKFWTGVSAPLRFLFFALMAVFLLSIAVFHRGLDLSPLNALYFVVTVFTTIGFGDISLLNAGPAVKLYGMFVMVCGAALFATLFSIITDFIVTARFQDLLGQRQVMQGGHVIVAGLGNVGYRVVEELLRAGQRPVVVENDPAGPFVKLVGDRAPMVLGDAALEEILTKAGAARAKAVIAATNSPITNLSIGLIVRELNPDARIVLRVFDAEFGDKISGCIAGCDVLSASASAAPTFVGAALYAGARHAFLLDGRFVCIVHQKLDAAPPARDLNVHFRRSQREQPFRRARADEPFAAGEEFIATIARPLS